MSPTQAPTTSPDRHCHQHGGNCDRGRELPVRHCDHSGRQDRLRRQHRIQQRHPDRHCHQHRGTVIAVGSSPQGIAITPDGKTALVGAQGSNKVHPGRHRHQRPWGSDHGRERSMGGRDHARPGALAAFGATAAPSGSPTAFDASASSDPDGQIAHFAWDFRRRRDACGRRPKPVAHLRRRRHLHRDADGHRRRGLLDRAGVHRTDRLLQRCRERRGDRQVTIESPPPTPSRNRRRRTRRSPGRRSTTSAQRRASSSRRSGKPPASVPAEAKSRAQEGEVQGLCLPGDLHAPEPRWVRLQGPRRRPRRHRPEPGDEAFRHRLAGRRTRYSRHSTYRSPTTRSSGAVGVSATLSEAVADAFQNAETLLAEGSSLVAGARLASRYHPRIIERTRLPAGRLRLPLSTREQKRGENRRALLLGMASGTDRVSARYCGDDVAGERGPVPPGC